MKEEKHCKDTYMPSIQEMQTWYEEDIRKNAWSFLADEDSKELKENTFFHTFRKFEERKYKLSCDENRDNIYYKKYKKYLEKEIERKKVEIEEIENRIQYERFFLRWERKINKKINKSSHYGSNSATRYRVDYIKDLETRLEKIISESKKAWEFYHRRKLGEDIEDKKYQKLIKVPYVADAKQRIIDSLDLGIPVYLVGHLGSGKTQLAIEAAKDFTVENKVQEELEEKLEEWFSLNTEVTEDEAIKKFKELNSKIRLSYEDTESLQPLLISGSHNLTYEDMFVEKTLSLKQNLSETTFSDYLNIIMGDFYAWINQHQEKLDKMTKEEQLQLKIQIWKSFSDLLVSSNSSFGTEIKKIEKEILIAVREGRPVIIDELNTIAMQNLIGLNDILQRRAGTTAYITGVGPVKIKHGFGLIGTGNLSTEMVNYEGTNELNPAFKSRFVTIEYNYLPQSIIGGLKDQEIADKNQLFRLIVTELADQDGNIHIPEAKKTMEELFRFSQLCKITQNVFIGKWRDDIKDENSNAEDLELRESVLSVRNILHVLNNWNMGEEKDLSKALWDGFISSITYADDQNFILSQAVRFGFFPENEGWNVKAKGIGEGISTYEEIRSLPYKYIRKEIETLSYLDLINIIFGEGPKTMSKELEEMFTDIADGSNMDISKYQELEEKVSHLEHSKNLLEHIEGKKI